MFLVHAQGSSNKCTDDENGSRTMSLETTEQRASEDKMVDVSKSGEVEEGLVENTSTSDWVTCPVCGCKVRGEDYMINSHLGMLFLTLFYFTRC